MKHSLKIVLVLLVLFLLAQVIGLFITKSYLKQGLPYNIERPEINEETSYIQFTFIIIIVTILALIITKLKLNTLWKVWFFLSVLIILSISLSSFLNQYLAFLIALILTILKIFKNNVYTHNISELFLYGGIAAVFVPLMNLFSVSIFLIIISVYDLIAVYKTKHMIALAEFQTKMKLFAGLYIPYKKKEAILGGGDIAFPLMFAGVILKQFGNIAFIVPVIATLSLFCLFLFTKKNKFYPAMPFLTIGCFIAYAILLIFK
nr:hypothetical protein [Candidatus Woesearchaeota archaeon]